MHGVAVVAATSPVTPIVTCGPSRHPPPAMERVHLWGLHPASGSAVAIRQRCAPHAVWATAIAPTDRGELLVGLDRIEQSVDLRATPVAVPSVMEIT